MAETRQFNVRIPDEARDVLTRIATRLREDGQFAARLEAWMDTLDDPTADDSLAERVARIEARLDAMEGGSLETVTSGTLTDNLSDSMNNVHRQLAGVESTPTDTPPGGAPSQPVTADTPPRDAQSQLAREDTPPLTTGEGRGRRLTTAGELEVERRIEAGEDNATIARALDVSTNTVQARRKEIAGRLL